MQRIYPATIKNEFFWEPDLSAKIPHGGAIGDQKHILNFEHIDINFNFIFVVRDYPYVNHFDNFDIFDNLTANALYELQNNPRTIFIFDVSAEGDNSGTGRTNFFSMFNRSCKKHNIDTKKIIFIAGNLHDKTNFANWNLENNIEPIKVITAEWYEWPAETLPMQEKIDSEHLILLTEYFLKEKYKGKYFNSLSRVNRDHRIYSTYMLIKNGLNHKALISHDTVNPNNILGVLDKFCSSSQRIRETLLDGSSLDDFINLLPLQIDNDNFNINWADPGIQFRHIYDQTLFSLTNETLVSHNNNTEFFLTEKTYRSITSGSPFLIWGAPGSHQHLKNLGYKLCDYFDYSFDNVIDNAERFDLILQQIINLCNHLDTLSYQEQLDWRFKYRNIAIHNYETLVQNSLDRKKDVAQEIKEYLNNLIMI